MRGHPVKSAPGQQLLFDFMGPTTTDEAKKSRSGTFIDNLNLPVHRWFRYSAGFSAEWATSLIRDRCRPEHSLVLDPFAGSGTALIAAENAGVDSVGFESHPFVFRVAQAKLLWKAPISGFREACRSVLSLATQLLPHISVPEDIPSLLTKCYIPRSLAALLALRESYARHELAKPFSQLVWLALTTILREVSHVGTAQWQYVLPKKRKSRPRQALDAFERKYQLMARDMACLQRIVPDCSAEILLHDARAALQGQRAADLVVTSPPYPNNYDYADATRLEMTFWGDVSRWADLHTAARKYLITSCSQHSAAEKRQLGELLDDPLLAPIQPHLSEVCQELARVRENKGGRKTYHTMVAAYFLDLARVWRALRAQTRTGATVCFIIGDSAPYGVYVPVDKWLGELAISAGFLSHRFERIRDRNVKWRNRKHTVPLQEGRLWVNG